jgi:hypothetical protein
MESSARSGSESSGKSRWFWWFLGGILVGVLGTVFLPDLLRPYMPQFLRGEDVEISGIVEAKSREADRLLLTIDGSAGAVLVTYTEQIPEMDLLIEPGDSVILAVREYAPFVEDPSVRRVQKGGTQRRAVTGPAGQAPAEAVRQEPQVERRQAPVPEIEETDPAQPPSDEEFRRDIGPESESDEPADTAGTAEESQAADEPAEETEPPQE